MIASLDRYCLMCSELNHTPASFAVVFSKQTVVKVMAATLDNFTVLFVKV